MAQTSNQDDTHYMEEELAEAQQDTSYGDGDGVAAEQYASPEPMKLSRRTSHKGQKSQTKGYQG